MLSTSVDEPSQPNDRSPRKRSSRSHQRIVEHASRLIRERGIVGSSVDEVMAAAGLTRGGFYAHFQDKVELAKEAIDHAFERSVTNLFGGTGTIDPPAWRKRAVRRYLSEAHMDDPGDGCAAPILAGEVARSDPRLRQTVQRGVMSIIQGIAEHNGGDKCTSRARAITFLATCVGAMALARAMADRSAAREILEACRASLLRDPEK